MKTYLRMLVCIAIAFAAVFATVTFRSATGYDGSSAFLNTLLLGTPGLLVWLTWRLTGRKSSLASSRQQDAPAENQAAQTKRQAINETTPVSVLGEVPYFNMTVWLKWSGIIAIVSIVGFLIALVLLRFSLDGPVRTAETKAIPGTESSNQSSNFAQITLPRGVELQIPKGWWLLGADHDRIIQTAVEAAMDLSGIGLTDGDTTNLVAANSMPRTTYAAVRVDSTTPPSASPSEFSSITADDIREMQTEIRQNLEKLLPQAGLQLIEFYGARIEQVSGYPTIVTEYRRTGPKGPVLVEVNRIFTPTQEIGINLSYRESEAVLWKAVVKKIRQSVVVRSWP